MYVDSAISSNYGEGENPGLSVTTENVSVHGLDVTGTAMQTRPKTQTTYWRSPYYGDVTRSAGRRLYLPPATCLTSYTSSQRPQTVNGQILPVKSILKRTSSCNSETINGESVGKGGKCVDSPNFITTGTGKGTAHGISLKPKTTGKRVKFNRLPSQAVFGLNALHSPDDNMNSAKTTGFKGRRLFLDRGTSARILGTSSRNMTSFQDESGKRSTMSVSLCGGESNIKAQVSDFIRKLRLAESTKRSDSRMSDVASDAQQRRTADKLRKSRTFTSLPGRPDWTDFDIDREEHKESQENVQQTKESTPDMFTDSQSIAETDSISIDSFTSDAEENNGGKSGTNSKRMCPKPSASLRTQYRHITTNYMNRYASKMSIVPNVSSRSLSKGSKSGNFCDSTKTDQIIGWLAEVNNANTSCISTDFRS